MFVLEVESAMHRVPRVIVVIGLALSACGSAAGDGQGGASAEFDGTEVHENNIDLLSQFEDACMSITASVLPST